MSHSKTLTLYEDEGHQTGNVNGVEVDLLGNDYFTGFLDGLAASAPGGLFHAGPSRLPISDKATTHVPVPPFLLRDLVLPQQDLDFIASSYPQTFQQIIDDIDRSEPTAPFSHTNINIDTFPTPKDSSPPKNYEWRPTLDKDLDFCVTQLPITSPTLQLGPLPTSTAFEFTAPTRKGVKSSQSGLDDVPEGLPGRFATKRGKLGPVSDPPAFRVVGADALVHPRAQLGNAGTIECAGKVTDDAVTISKSSSPDASQQSHSSDASDDQSLVGKKKRNGPVPAPAQIVFRAYGAKRARFNEKSRNLTARTREVGACGPCRKKKIRCDQPKNQFGICGGCAKMPARLLYSPCCRIDIIDIKLFRLGTTLDPLASTLPPWMQSKVPANSTLLLQDGITSFEPPRKVLLTHDVCTTTFEVTISRYQPGPNERTGYSWANAAGHKCSYELPPYYILDLAEASRNMCQYVRKARGEFTRALLVNSNPVVSKVFMEAERFYADSKSKLVAGALMLWSATRMIERFWLITGPDTLGLSPMTGNIGPCRFNPLVEAIPVTPIMDTQLDEIAIKHVLIPLKNKVLRLFKEKVLGKKKNNWYEVFLASFIILHSSEIVLNQVMDYSKRYGISFAPSSNDESSLSHAYYHACKTVLAYFHFASGGAAPLALNWHSPSPDTSIMSHRQIEFLRDLKDELDKQNGELQTLRNKSMYENEMFWCHQLLLDDWKADMPYLGIFLSCTEKDFILS